MPVDHPAVIGLLAAAGVLATASAVAAGLRSAAAGRVARRLTIAGNRAGGRVLALPAPVVRHLSAAGISADRHHSVLGAWVVAGGVALAAATVSGGAGIVVVAVLVGPPVVVLASRGRAERLRRRDLPGALDATVAALRAGHSLTDALAHAGATPGPARAELATIGRTASAGTPLVGAVATWAEAHHDPDTRLAAAALAVAAEAGGPGADGIEAAAASLRSRAAVDDEIQALSVQARASATLLTATPVAFTALLTAVDPAAGRFLLGSGVGRACLVAGLGLDAIGALWMRRLVSRAR